MALQIEAPDDRIHIRAKKIVYAYCAQQPIIRIEPDAYNMLVELANSSGISIKQIASTIIRASVDKVVFDE